MPELEHYLILSHEYEKNIKPSDVSLAMIRAMLAGWFGIKEPRESETEQKIKKMAKAKISKEEKDAWIKDGMPSPFNIWLANYRGSVK